MSSVSAEEDEAQQIADPEPERETPTKLGAENGEQKEKNGEKEQTAENGDQKQQESTENPVADANGDGDEGRIAVSPEEAEEQQMEFGTRQSALVPHEEEGIPVSDEEDNADQQQQDEMSAEAKAKPAVVDDLSVAKEISEYMKVNRINPGELDTLDDMWAICDAISAAHSGLPDSLLREAFLLVLEGFQSYAKTNPWLRKQLDQLSRMWKRCMVSGTKYNRPTKFVCAPASETISAPTTAETADEQDIHGENGESQGQQSEQQQETATIEEDAAPQPPDTSTMSASKLRRQRRQRDKRKRALAVMMGVGEMLTQARRKFATEEGELDIDEDEYGNFSIGGMELSFENWGQLNQIKDAGIVRSTVQPPKRWRRGGGQASKQRMGPKTAMTSIAVDETPNLPTIEEGKQSNGTPKGQMDETMGGQQQQQIDMAREYPTVAEVEMEGMEPMPMSKKDRKAMEREAKQKRREEKDEGEISTTDDEATSSSEESSSEDEAGGHHRHKRRKLGIPTKMMTTEAATMGTPQERRRARREEERKQGASSAQNLQVLLRKCFELRSRIVGKLSIGQKAMFRDLLSKSIAGTLQPAQQQQGQLQDLINSFVGSE